MSGKMRWLTLPKACAELIAAGVEFQCSPAFGRLWHELDNETVEAPTRTRRDGSQLYGIPDSFE